VIRIRAVKQEGTAPQDSGWRRHLPDIEVINVQGDHQTMLESKTLPDEFLGAVRKASPRVNG
jgi:thioesterase domain-containing protein